jgi:hypothetical protein
MGVDECMREAWAIAVPGASRSARVVEVLARLVSPERGIGSIGASSSSRVAQPRFAASDQRQRNQNRPDRARETVAERDQRALQRHPARRMPERRVVLLARRGPRHHRKLATPLQRGEAPLKPSALLDPAGVSSAVSRPVQPGSPPQALDG